MSMMFPPRRRLAWSEANPAGPDELAVSSSAFDFARYFSGTRQMVDHHRVADRRLRRPKGPFFDDGGVQPRV